MTAEQQKTTLFHRLFGKCLLKSWRLWGLIFLLTYTLSGFFGVPYIIKSQLIAKTPEFTDRVLSLEQVEFNPFALSLRMKGVSLADLDNVELAGLDELYVNFEVESLFRWAWTFDEIHFSEPRFNLRIDKSGQTSFADLLAGDDSAVAATVDNTEGRPPELPRLVLHSFKVSNGQFMFADHSIITPYQQNVTPISFELSDFSTLPEREGPYAIQATLPDGATFRWQGEVSVNPIRSEGRVEIDQFDITTAWRYAQDQLRFSVDQGLMTTSIHYDLSMGEAGMALLLDEIKLALTDISIRDKESREPAITLSAITLSGGQLNLAKQTVQLDQLTVAGGDINTFINKQGEVDLARLFTPINTSSTQAEQPPEEIQESNPWLIELNKATLKALSIGIADQTTSPTAEIRLDDISIELSNISNQPDDRFALDASLSINGEGRLGLQGEVGAMPVMADLTLSLATFPLKSVQPYLNANTNLNLTAGHAAFKGQLSYMKSGTPADLQLVGQAAISAFAAGKQKTRGQLVAWQALTLDDLTLQIAPDRLDIKTITLDKLQTQLVVAKDQTINVAGLVKESTAAEQNSPAKGKPFPVTIDSVVLKRNAISFTDHSVTPRFTSRLSEFQGTIQGLSSENIARAKVKLNGKVDDYAALKISGKINPLSEELYTDLKIDFIGYDMATFTPYTGKFIGSAIDKGRMTLSLAYFVSQNELKGDNQILLDQFTLGRDFESKDATSLPVGLAIALLKDASGRIDIDMPIRGNLDDPEFGFFHLIPPALLNLVTGIISSPFKLLGKLVGGGAGNDMDNVVFLPGQYELAADQIERLTTLGKVLNQRPQLRLDVRGQYDSTLDKAVLQQQKLHESLQISHNISIESLDLTQLETHYVAQTDSERLTTIKTENSHLPKGAKEGDSQVIDQSTYKIALYNAAVTIQPLVEDDLRDLALARANHVRNYLVENSGLAAERIFILDVRMAEANPTNVIKAQFNLGAN